MESHLRILCVLKILETYSDEKHPLSLADIKRLLEEDHNISVHRITISKDILALQEYGVDVVALHSTQNHYFIGDRLFETPELRLLIDAIHSSKCLTVKKSEELITKLMTLTSTYQADELRARPLSATVTKPKNEQVYYIIDAINHAIHSKKMIYFSYTDYMPDKSRVLRGDGEIYALSPYACVWSGDYYYVIGWSDKRHDIAAFRVDRIADIPRISHEAIIPPPAGFNLCEYSKTVFHMYKGQFVTVELQCANELMKTVIDRFGDDVETAIFNKNSFKVTTQVSLSPTFYGWLFEFGGKIRILSPAKAKEEYKKMTQAVLQSL